MDRISIGRRRMLGRHENDAHRWGASIECQQLKGQTSGDEEQEERSGGDGDQLCFRIKYC